MSEYDYSLKIQQIQQSNTNLISNIFNVKKEEDETDPFANIVNYPLSKANGLQSQ